MLREIIVGRGPEVDYLVPGDPYVSVQHCAIMEDTRTGAHWVKDLGSDNGTFIVDRFARIHKLPMCGLQRLQQGDRIRVGRTILPFTELQG